MSLKSELISKKEDTFMRKKKHFKKKRQQPRPKSKRKVTASKTKKGDTSSFESQMKVAGKQILDLIKDKETLNTTIHQYVSDIEEYFQKYDTIQLLGSVGLYLLDNLPNMEKHLYAHLYGVDIELDEKAEIMVEYAMNFGLALPNDSKESPTNEIAMDLLTKLSELASIFELYDMPSDYNSEKLIDWLIHMQTIAVRGDGYQEHVYEVFKEMFVPHSAFYQQRYGFSIEEMFEFFMDLENRVICKIGSQNSIYGVTKMHERWKKWEKKTYGDIDDITSLDSRDWSKGLFGDFFEANPDVPHTEDGMNFILVAPNDYSQSNKVFWVYPQNEIEEKILNALSVQFGSNAAFLADGEFKGSIMSGYNIFERPFVKDGDKYYCFTPMIPHRNLFFIAEKLMMRDNTYYQKHFQQNKDINSRDEYIERKVKSVMQNLLPDVHFYSSVNYSITEDGIVKHPELDILGISDKATYIIEVKAHELSYKDKVGLKGAKDKFCSSVVEACKQCCRSLKFIETSKSPVFSSKEKQISIDKSKPIYKIAVTFQHHSALLGQMDALVGAGLMEEQYRDTWIVSLFDLMVVSDFIESEDEFMAYLDMHRVLNTNHSTYCDELDLLGQFLNEDLANKVKNDTPFNIMGGHEDIDAEYSKDNFLDFSLGK